MEYRLKSVCNSISFEYYGNALQLTDVDNDRETNVISRNNPSWMKGTLCILSNQFIDVVSISVLSFVSRFVLCIVERERAEWQVASATNTTVGRFTWRRRAALAPSHPLRPRATPCPRGRADGDGGLVRRRRVEFRVRGRLTAEPCFSRPANSRAEPSHVR